MAKKKYYYQIEFPDETIDSRSEGEFFDTEEEALEAAEYALSCCAVGAETLHLSNPGDYPDPDAHTEDGEIFIYKA